MDAAAPHRQAHHRLTVCIRDLLGARLDQGEVQDRHDTGAGERLTCQVRHA
ncbi:MAG: hypothetical protein O3A20_01475 [Planctomycetota bacterium]|nr:hypothetical protein [Planctomycetota bacterium]